MAYFFKYLPENALSKKIEKGSFPFSQYLFWDTPIEKIDVEKHKNYIIERVLSRGLLTDFYFLLQLYSTEDIINAVKKSKALDKKTVGFCNHYFKIPIKEMHASSFYI
ncbi:MAG: hypothetical protein M3R50_08740 [Bacteroidota bacterium]|nr:hypothetical protein [Bacteroidota bacterium]